MAGGPSFAFFAKGGAFRLAVARVNEQRRARLIAYFLGLSKSSTKAPTSGSRIMNRTETRGGSQNNAPFADNAKSAPPRNSKSLKAWPTRPQQPFLARHRRIVEIR